MKKTENGERRWNERRGKETDKTEEKEWDRVKCNQKEVMCTGIEQKKEGGWKRKGEKRRKVWEENEWIAMVTWACLAIVV